MRLIDADELYRSIRIQVNSSDEDYGRALLNIALKVSNAEGVKAIPIEWIKRYAKKGGRIANILFPFEIEMMLEEWEKENETN